MFQVRKRDGKLVEFDMSKITTALSKAFNAKKIDYTVHWQNSARKLIVINIPSAIEIFQRIKYN